MSHTITVRLNKELAAWLEETSAKSGVSQGQLIRDQLERAKTRDSSQAFMKLAGVVRGLPRNLSARKGFSRQ
jgi:ribbon-helix-helix CopG family protein